MRNNAVKRNPLLFHIHLSINTKRNNAPGQCMTDIDITYDEKRLAGRAEQGIYLLLHGVYHGGPRLCQPEMASVQNTVLNWCAADIASHSKMSAACGIYTLVRPSAASASGCPGIGLIECHTQGLGKPDIIYVKNLPSGLLNEPYGSPCLGRVKITPPDR